MDERDGTLICPNCYSENIDEFYKVYSHQEGLLCFYAYYYQCASCGHHFKEIKLEGIGTGFNGGETHVKE